MSFLCMLVAMMTVCVRGSLGRFNRDRVACPLSSTGVQERKKSHHDDGPRCAPESAWARIQPSTAGYPPLAVTFDSSWAQTR